MIENLIVEHQVEEEPLHLIEEVVAEEEPAFFSALLPFDPSYSIVGEVQV